MTLRLVAALSLTLACACGRPQTPLVLTELPSPPSARFAAALRQDLDARYPAGSRVVLKDGAGSRTLSRGLWAAGGPTVSPDGLRVLFAGKASPDGHWSIYEVTLRGLPHKIADLGRDCADPAYIAGNRAVFSCRVPEGGWALHTAPLEPDGSLPHRISFGPDGAADPCPLPDGRILFALLGGSGGLFTVNPDGSGVAAYAGLHDSRSGGGPGADAAVYEAVPLIPSGPLKGRPSAVDLRLSTGTLLCVDADLSDGTSGPRRGSPRAAWVEFLAAGDGRREISLGGSAVEEDGSFLVEVPADRPLRVRTADRQGRTIAVSSPFWVRPGEVRSCTGCHEGHERMAPNRPLRALRHDPRPLEPGTRERSR